MAQRVEIVLIDDLDGSEATETVSFALDGTNYEIDLNDENAARLRDAFSQYVENGRRVRSTRQPSRAKAATSDVDTRAVRAWAKANKMEVSERGRIPAAIIDAYKASN